MKQRYISISEDLYIQIQKVRKIKHLSWEGLFKMAVREAKIREQFREIKRTYNRKLKISSLAERFQKNELKMMLLFVEPVTKELLTKQHQSQRKLPDQIVDQLVWEKFGEKNEPEEYFNT